MKQNKMWTYVVSIVALFFTVGTGQETCPNGWTYFSESCYFFADEMNLDWIESTHYCAVHKGHLVKVDTAEEDNFLQNNCRRLFNGDDIPDNDSFWLGAADDIIEGVWMWYVDDTELEYVNWNDGQPDSSGGNQDCLSLHSSQNFKWHDYQCEALYHPICEINLYDEGEIVG